MISIGYYLLKTSIVSGIFFLIYQILLRKESFFQLNRFYLLVSLVFSYVFPFTRINVYPFTNTQLPIISSIQSSINQFSFTEEISLNEISRPESNSIPNEIGLYILVFISAILIFRFLRHLTQIIKTIQLNEKIKHAKFTLVLLKKHNTFSFFRYIFISQTNWDSTNRNLILKHELSHIRHKHSFDRLFVEVLMILFWMNPFIYLYRKALEEVHEFQADNDAINNNESISDYFRLVLQQSADKTYMPLMSPFSYQLIKKRIIMSNYKSKSIKKFFLILPVTLAVLVVTITNTKSFSQYKVEDEFSQKLTWPESPEEASMLFYMQPDENLKGNKALAENALPILINAKGQLLLKGNKVEIKEVKSAVISFLSKSGLSVENLDNANYSNISFVYLQRDINTSDKDADALLNEVSDAFSELRNNIAINHFNKPFNDCISSEKDAIIKFAPNRIYIAEPKNMLGTEKESKNLNFINPIKEDYSYEITSQFGMRVHPILKMKKMHKGTDFKAELNTPVVAIEDGSVREIELNFEQGKGYGKYIIIDHANGYSSLYAQLSEYKTKAGDKVKQGDVIGLVGSSGTSTGPHLHLEIKKDGKNIDPMKIIK
ncbi:peptidoglycan DD-metalloendopeptidase family protein [Carboxylicivirga caseinilyticus]|uniref:peptidoglycan DD-metalloendopeptidase family protein n=1 Tax=Carboxylicivirga caseinilyticus TaxID=3417572 RepID=UPI003D348BE9|nr:peptidoglycan DD-metalloendopeptidase family protein [Marinilabiliaceae bacterium A049]